MSGLISRSAKLVPYAKRPKSIPSFATAYTYEPEDPAALALGVLLVAIEVVGPPKQSEEAVDLVIETIGTHYYNTDEIDSVAKRFELAVKAVNADLSGFTSHGNASWVGKLSAVIAVVANDELHVTGAGSAEGFLVRGHKLSSITQGLYEKAAPQAATKTFGSIASGQVQKGDRLLLTTPALIHHLDKAHLREVVSENSPNAAIAKITEKISNATGSERVAAVVTEITTVEAMAMQALPDEPDEIQIGRPENAFDAAKIAASPVTGKAGGLAAATGSKIAALAKNTLAPAAHSGGLWAVKRLRSFLTGPRGRRRAIIALAVVAIGVTIAMSTSNSSANIDKSIDQFKQLVAKNNQAASQIAAGDKAGARITLEAVKRDLAVLQKSNTAALDKALAKKSHPENDPNSVAELVKRVTEQSNILDGLATATGITVFDYSSLKGASPRLINRLGNNIILMDTGASPKIYVYDKAAGKLKFDPYDASTMGAPVASTVSSSGDGVYILTEQPAVWFYNPIENSLKSQDISFGNWPKGTALASYNTNLYILSSEGVTKHVRTLSGFSGKNASLSAADIASISSPNGLSVDGSLIVGGSKPILKRYLAGSVSATIDTIPESLTHPLSLESLDDGTLIAMVDKDSKRLGLVAYDGTALTYLKQYQLDNNRPIYAATIDTKTKTVYAITDKAVVSFVYGF